MTLPKVIRHLNGRAGIPPQTSGGRGCQQHLVSPGHGPASLLIQEGRTCLLSFCAFMSSSSFPRMLRALLRPAFSRQHCSGFSTCMPLLCSVFFFMRKPSFHFPSICTDSLRWSFQEFPVQLANCLPKVIRNEGWRCGVAPASRPRSFESTLVHICQTDVICTDLSKRICAVFINLFPRRKKSREVLCWVCPLQDRTSNFSLTGEEKHLEAVHCHILLEHSDHLVKDPGDTESRRKLSVPLTLILGHLYPS